MTTLREAAQQALEALEGELPGWRTPAQERAITALRAALEPVAWQWLNTAHFRKKLPADAEPGAWNPLYTHPPRREWRGLTEEEISALFPSHLRGDYKDLIPYSFARAVEAALRSKNYE